MNYQTQSRELLNGRALIFTLANPLEFRHDPSMFRRFVEMAAEFGATHVTVGRVPFRYGTAFLPDNHDPYAAWCNTSFNLLWSFPPPPLREWIARDEACYRQEYLAAQMEELRRFGLKGVVEGIEPLWLPEAVYRAHPHWRGAQCELGRIARRPYFTPSIDEPEVLDLYRAAMREVAARFPEIDQFNFLTNDSGGGIAWTPNIYPGMNGPARWRRRSTGERIAGWLSALQDGAAQAGVQARVRIFSGGHSPETVSATKALLRPGQYLNGVGGDDEPWAIAGAGLGAGAWTAPYPAAGLSDPAAFVAGLQQVFDNREGDKNRVAISVDEAHLPRARVLLEAFLHAPATGVVSRAGVLHAAASTVCGTPQYADTLVEAWQNIARATQIVSQVRQKGISQMLPFCGVSMRWITRPLVPQPSSLRDDETSYFRRFLFSVNSDRENDSFHFVLGKSVFNGESVMWMARWCLQEAYDVLKNARTALEKIAGQLEGEAAARLGLDAARAGAYACLVKNAQNVIRYQYALDTVHHPQFGWNVMDYDENILYDQRGVQLRKIAREELDNTQELIEILESQSEPVVIHAQSADEENVFMLGPDLAGDLRRKMNVMLDHWQEYETLFPATKVWELEPATSFPAAEASGC
jgi:hypothetical protein